MFMFIHAAMKPSMNTQHGHVSSMEMGTQHGQWTCIMDMDMQPRHGMQYGQDMQYGYGHGHAARTRTCSMNLDMQHKHGPAAWTGT
jgi:hypothetical protein